VAHHCFDDRQTSREPTPGPAGATAVSSLTTILNGSGTTAARSRRSGEIVRPFRQVLPWPRHRSTIVAAAGQGGGTGRQFTPRQLHEVLGFPETLLNAAPEVALHGIEEVGEPAGIGQRAIDPMLAADVLEQLATGTTR